MTWLVDTLVWTGTLIAFVLLTRRPVARHFGPRAAYALWLLPLIRLALPPIVLPAWLAPAPSSHEAAGELVLLVPAASMPATAAAAPVAMVDWTSAIVAVWLIGTAIYGALRVASYFRLRRELLAQARTVGQAGRVRLVETPATASPLAFGVFDKVVALPPEFMAWPDRKARDLALAHELAHHRAHDLVVNFCALPLFALHWFNPLSWLGWQAMRRDQEAACDARVVEHCDHRDRVAYAVLIAGTVAGPRGALAAPMACPVLGDKSIVHRLRNLTMTTQSPLRRRAGAFMVGAGALLLPLTASFSYAQEPAAPPPSPAPPEAPLPPGPPGPPDVPLPPEMAEDTVIVRELADAGNGNNRRVIVIRSGKDGEHGRVGNDAKREIRREFRVLRSEGDGPFDEKAFEKQRKDLEIRLGKLGEEMGDLAVVDAEKFGKLHGKSFRIERMAPMAMPRVPLIEMKCDGDGPVSDTTSADGKRVIRVCRSFGQTHAAMSLRAARDQIARQGGMNEETRNEVLRSLDGEIERLEAAKEAPGK